MFVVQIVFPFKTAILFVAPKIFLTIRKSDKEMVNFAFLFVPKNGWLIIGAVMEATRREIVLNKFYQHSYSDRIRTVWSLELFPRETDSFLILLTERLQTPFDLRSIFPWLSLQSPVNFTVWKQAARRFPNEGNDRRKILGSSRVWFILMTSRKSYEIVSRYKKNHAPITPFLVREQTEETASEKKVFGKKDFIGSTRTWLFNKNFQLDLVFSI